jgi:HD-GYP domain-containing protein (c-di-GMP phosphodiesterase class II)
MTMPRGYQATRTISQAIREIRRLTGQQFDPEVVNAFLSVPVQVLQTIHPGSNAEAGGVLQIENDSPDRLAVAAGSAAR